MTEYSDRSAPDGQFVGGVESVPGERPPDTGAPARASSQWRCRRIGFRDRARPLSRSAPRPAPCRTRTSAIYGAASQWLDERLHRGALVLRVVP
jgi:hypothetical protein